MHWRFEKRWNFLQPILMTLMVSNIAEVMIPFY